MTETVQRASQMARPSSSVRAMAHTCKVRPTRIGVAVAIRCPSRQGAEVAGVQFDADDALARARGQGGAETGGRLGQQCGHAAVEDAVGLVHPPVDRQPEDDAIRGGLEHLDAEQAVDAGGRVDRGQAGPSGGGGSSHRRMITVRR